MKQDSTTLQNWCDRLAKPYLHNSSSVIVAMLTPDHQHIATYGRIDETNPQAPKPDTLFEIGSITKVFTSILLAKLSNEGRIDIDAPIAEIRKEFSNAPKWITPRTLATHTSGLPRLHVPLWKAVFMDTTNPYADFSQSDLIKWIQNYKQTKPPKTDQTNYSNLGAGLLGHVISMVGGTSFETLLKTEILEPLDLTDTTITLTEDQNKRFAQPHKTNGQATPAWTFDALAGAGALRSNIVDLKN